MASNVADTRRHVRYEPDESPPNLLSLGFGMQHAMLAVPSIVLGPALLIQAAGGSDAQLMWAVCTALAICGITTAVQAVRVGRIGAGYVMLMGSSSAFLAVSVSALEQGGPGLLATLIIVASLFQFALAARLSALRRIFTPTVAGTAVMLIPVTLAPIILGKLADVPDGASASAAPVTAGITLLVIVVTALRGSSLWRLWGPIAGIVAGTVTGSLAFGLYDTAGIRQAGWIGLPPIAWPGLDLGFGVEFWALLPAFVLVTLVGAMNTLSNSVAIQRFSWPRPRAIDFRSIRGAMSAHGLGNLLSGLAGTLPNTSYATGISIVKLTGVAARSVGVCIGLIFVAIAIIPKFLAVIIAIPGPVVAGYFLVLVTRLFTFGIEILQHEGLDPRRGVVVGVAFWIGLAFQFEWISPGYFPEPWSELGNAVTAGGLTVIALTLFEEVAGPRRRRLRVALNADAYPKIDGFLAKLGARRRWSEEMIERVRAVGEEALVVLSRGEEERTAENGRWLLLVAGSERNAAVLEFIAGTDETNLDDQMPLLDDRSADGGMEQEVPLGLLRRCASSVRHNQYHDTDVMTVRVESSSHTML